MTTLNFGTICATVGLLLLLVSKLVATRKRKIEAARRGCGHLPVVPGNDFLGITRFRQFLQARREKRALPWMVDLMDSAGKDVHTAKDTIVGHSFIWTRDMENSRAVLAAQADDFDIGRTRQESLLCVIGSGIFTRTGRPWRDSRAFLRPHFAREHVSSFDPLETHFQALLKVIKEQDDGWTSSFDIQPLIFNYTLDVATEFLFGTSANAQAALAAGEFAQAEFHYHWDSAATYFGIRALLGRFVWMYNPKKFQKHCDAIHAYADGYVHAAIERQQQRKQQGVADEKPRFVLLDELVDITHDRIRLRSECLNVLGAARTSTASLIQWVLYFLARHPSTFDKLRTIILSDFGSFENREKITFDGLKRCDFLTHCVNETLRISPVIPVHIRAAARDTTLPRGGGPNGKDPIFVPKGTEIRQVFYGTCMQTDIWGEDTATFRPERFENRKLSSQWIPFGSGPRMCLGQSLALSITSYLIVRLLQKFDRLENTDAPGPIKYEWSISNRSANGVNVRLHTASHQKK
ncbi:putative cytochrome P450 [Usnea florida]